MYPQPLRALVDELGRLPGIGPKSAQRLAFYLLRQPEEDARRLAAALVAMREETSLCEICCNVADRTGRCDTCSDPRRDTAMICVVEDPRDVVAVERSGAFRGTYHVLHGALNPLEGVGADQLHVAELKSRLAEGTVNEVILCMNPNVEGDATATLPHQGRSPRSASRSPGRRAGCRSAATSSSPTTRHSSAPSRDAGPSSPRPDRSALQRAARREHGLGRRAAEEGPQDPGGGGAVGERLGVRAAHELGQQS